MAVTRSYLLASICSWRHLAMAKTSWAFYKLLHFGGEGSKVEPGPGGWIHYIQPIQKKGIPAPFFWELTPAIQYWVCHGSNTNDLQQKHNDSVYPLCHQHPSHNGNLYHHGYLETKKNWMDIYIYRYTHTYTFTYTYTYTIPQSFCALPVSLRLHGRLWRSSSFKASRASRTASACDPSRGNPREAPPSGETGWKGLVIPFKNDMIPWSYIKWWFPWWNKKKLPNADSLRHVAFVVFYPMFQKYSVSAPCLKGHRLIIMMIMSWISKTQIVALKPTNLICPWTCDISYLLKKKRWIRHWQNIVVLSLMYLCNIYIYIYLYNI